MDKTLGLLAALATGVGLYFIAENTPEGKRVLTNVKQSVSNIIHPIPTPVYQPISTVEPRAPVAPSRGCPPGYYKDYTDGILTCRDAHGIRELQNLRGGSTIENAWAAPPLIPTPSPGQTLAPPKPEPQILPGPITPEKKPSHIKKTANDDKKKKRHLEPSKDKIATQIECPSDLKTLKCGSNCYKDGKLYKITCSEKQKQSLYIPPNFPQAVTVGGDQYPETDTSDQTDVGGTVIGPPTVAPTDNNWNPPGQTPITSTPPPPVQGVGLVFYPFRPWAGKYFGFKHGDTIDPNGCVDLELHSGGSTKSCRWLADRQMMLNKIGNNGYRIDADITLGEPYTKNPKNQELSITSGGPGSSGKNCCGFTCRINIKDGTLQMESEDWSEGSTTGATYCRGASCVQTGPTSISSGGPLYNSTIHIAWVVTRQGNNATYHMEATGPGGTIISKSFTNPHAHKSGGPPIIPFHIISGKLDTDADRIRVDSCKTVNFHTPKVTVLPARAFFGELGYIDGEDFLI